MRKGNTERSANPCGRVWASKKTARSDHCRWQNFEHFDEQIDEWFATSKNRIHVDRIIGPASVIGGVAPLDMFRVFDPTTAEVVFWGERYPLKTIMDEVTRLYPLARAQGDKPA